MSDEYTPSMDELRDAFAGHGKGYANASHYERQGAEFDRAMAAHDAELVARAEAAEAKIAAVEAVLEGERVPDEKFGEDWILAETLRAALTTTGQEAE